MPKRRALPVLLAASWLGSAPSVEARILRQEPPMGRLKPGERVLVEDGSCGAGQVLEVIGGDHVKAGGRGYTERRKRCIPRR